MKRADSRILKPVFIAVTIFLVLTLKDLLTEMVGGKIGDYLRDNLGVTTITFARLFCALGRKFDHEIV